MHWIDRFAYTNRIRKLDPAYKAGISLFVIVVCLTVNRPLISFCLMVLMLTLSIIWAGLPAGFALKLLVGEGTFLLLGVLSVAVSISTAPTPGAYPIGSIWFCVTVASIRHALSLLLRALSCTVAMNFLALTTPLVDLIDLLRRLRTPELLIDLMTLIYRFVFVLIDCLDRMILAQESRLGFTNWRKSFHSAGHIGANLFIEAFRRSQKMELSLESRCWNGTLHVLPETYEKLKWPWPFQS